MSFNTYNGTFKVITLNYSYISIINYINFYNQLYKCPLSIYLGSIYLGVIKSHKDIGEEGHFINSTVCRHCTLLPLTLSQKPCKTLKKKTHLISSWSKTFTVHKMDRQMLICLKAFKTCNQAF